MKGLIETRWLLGSTWLFWAFLLLVTLAEVLTAVIEPRVGLAMHTMLLFGLLAFAAVTRNDTESKFALSLTLAPMIRLLSLTLPLTRFPQMSWYGMVAVPLFVATWMIIRHAGVSQRALGLQAGHVLIEMMLMSVGVGLGMLEYIILRPAAPQLPLEYLLLSAVSLLVFTGLLEELVFRGLMQSLSLPVLGRWALIYVSLLFGVLHIGHLSFIDVGFVALVGLLFAYLVRWGRSILGVTLAHGATNITMFLVMPTLELYVPGLPLESAPYILMVSGMMLFSVMSMLYWNHKFEQPLSTHLPKARDRAGTVA